MFLEWRLPRLGGLPVPRASARTTDTIAYVDHIDHLGPRARPGANAPRRVRFPPQAADAGSRSDAATAGVVLERARRRSFWNKWKFGKV